MKESLRLLYIKITNCNNSLILGVAVFLIFVSISLTVLNFHEPLIDWELQKYGNMGVAMIDDITSQINLTDIQILRRENSEFLLAPVVALFFSIFGENYYTLQKMGVFLTGFWALVWFLVACQLFNKKKIWLATIFAFATPLMHLQKSPGINIFTHVGVSILFGLSLLFLIRSQLLEKNKKRAFLVISGFVYSVSFFYGFISLLLLPIILILFLKPQLRFSGFVFWVLGFLIAFVFYFQYQDWGFLQQALGAAAGSEFEFKEAGFQLKTSFLTLISLLVYFGGILKNDLLKITQVENPAYSYSIISIFYLLFLLVLSFYHLATGFLKKGALKIKNVNIDFFAFFIGSIIFLLTVAHVRFMLSFENFDGLRYLIPLIPFYLLAISYFLIRDHNKVFAKACFLLYIGFTFFALFFSVYPFQENNKEAYSRIGGFNAVYLLDNPELATQINLENAAADRLGRYTLAMGRAYAKLPYDFFARKKEIKEQLSARPADVTQHALDEFTRGYYFRNGLNLNSCQAIQKFFEENNYRLDPLIAQGVGMGVAKRSIDKKNIDIQPKNQCLKEVYSLADKDTLKNLGWGYGRHFYYSERLELFTSEKFMDSLELYEGILQGMAWSQKHYRSQDFFYTWVHYFD